MYLALLIVVFCIGFLLAVISNARPKHFLADPAWSSGILDYGLHTLKPAHGAQFEDEPRCHHCVEYGHGSDFLLSIAQVKARYSENAWQRQVCERLAASISGHGQQDKKYPCVYAAKGFKDDQHRYVFLLSGDPSEPRNIRILGESLGSYLRQSRGIGRNTSLIAITPPSSENRGLDEYERRFWTALRGLRVYDTTPWPKDMPGTVNSSRWAFCFNGWPVFPVAMAPAYRKRHSRWAPSLCIAFQPKWVFDELLATEAKRNGAVAKVRDLLCEYDDVPPSPSLTAYGAPGTTESHQLFLRDDNDGETECPFDDFDAD